MLGIIGGLIGAIAYVATSAQGEWTANLTEMILIAFGIFVAASVLGLLMPINVGIASLYLMGGSFIAALVAVFRGEHATAAGLVFHSAAFYANQVVIVRRRERLSRKDLAGGAAPGGEILLVSRGYLAPLFETMLDSMGSGKFIAYADHSSRFVTDRGNVWDFRADHLSSWRVEADRAALDAVPTFKPAQSCVVIRGPKSAMSPSIFIHAERRTDWLNWLREGKVTEAGESA